MTPDAIYDVLVQECGASEGLRDNFVDSFKDTSRYMVEYGFPGVLNTAWHYFESPDGWRYVTCYVEDETPERRAIIDAANQRLKGLA